MSRGIGRRLGRALGWTVGIAALAALTAAAPLAAQSGYADDFESYGVPGEPPGWFDSAPGNPSQEAPGQYKVWTDPADPGNAAFGKQGAADSASHWREIELSPASPFAYAGRIYREKSQGKLGLRLFTTAASPEEYFLVGQAAANGTVRLSSVRHGALTGDVESEVALAKGVWHRFRIETEPAGGGLRIRANVWRDGEAEPAGWQIDAVAETLPPSGWFGVWAAGSGLEMFDDLVVSGSGGGPGPDPLELAITESGAPLDDGAVFARAVTPVVVATGGTPPLTISATLDGAPFDSGSTVESEGAHTLVASVSDAAAQSLSATVHFTIDTTGPQFLSFSPPDGTVLPATSVTIAGEVDGASAVTVDGSAASLAGTLFSAGPFALAEGERTFLIEATDAAGNATQALLGVVRDTLPPTVSITSPVAGVVGASPIAVAGTAVDPHLAEVRVNDQPAALTGSSFTLAALALVAGDNTITARATDSVGNFAEASIVVTLDPDPPAVAILESGAPLEDGTRYGRAVVPVVEVTDATPVTVEATLDGAAFASGSTVSAEGPHLLVVVATDAAGHSATAAVHFTIDLSPPVFGATSPADGALLADAEVTITGEVQGATEVTVDGAPATLVGTSFSAGPFPLADGPRVFHLAAADDVGNAASLDLHLERDGTAPVLAVTAPAEGLVTAQETIAVSGTASDPHLDEVRVAGLLATLSGESFTVAAVPLVEGDNDLAVVARDTLANATEIQVQVVRDTIAPTLAILEQGAPLADGALFARAVTPVIETDDATAVEVAATLDGAPFTSGATVSAEGLHTLDVEATDAAGNATAATVLFTIDTTPPVFVSVAPADGAVTGAATVTLTGRVAGAATLTVDGAPASLVGEDFAAGPFTLAEGERIFALEAADEAGNVATRSHRIVRDATAPVLALQSPAENAVLGDASVQVVGTVSEPHLDAITVNGVSASVTGSTFVAAQVPLAEGPNTLAVHAVDTAGNAADLQRTVERDSTPPVIQITDPAAGTVVRDATITVSGTAEDDHLDRVEVAGEPATLSGGSWSVVVPLAEGENTLVAIATDALGRTAQASRVVRRDATAPELAITAPAEGARLASATVTVTGTVEQEEGLVLTVNGDPVDPVAGAFTAEVELVEGENRIIVRATDAQGNRATRTRTVWLDTEPPALVSSDPPDGAIELPFDTRFRLLFSEPIGELAPGAVTLETAAGDPIPFAAVRSGAGVELVPSAPLPSSAELRLGATAAIVDRAGNALAVPRVLGYATSDGEVPPPPVVSPQPPAFLCAAEVELAGAAEPLARIEVTGGAVFAEGDADAAGAFVVAAPLTANAANVLAVVAVDAAGNRSAAAEVEVVQDCVPPRVVALTPSDPPGDGVEIRFSEPLEPASIAGAVSVESAAGPHAGTTALAAGGDTIEWLADEPLPAGALRVEVAALPTDLAGNPMAYPFSQLLGGDPSTSFLAGAVLDDSTGRPLEGVRVWVWATDGAPLAAPWPEQTTAADGRFSIAVPAGTHDVAFVRAGFAPAFRIVTTESGRGTDVFDPRLAPLAAPATVGTAGGTVEGAPVGPGGPPPRLTVPSGVFPGPATVGLTGLSAQGLPALLPYGWTPRGAAYLLASQPLGAAAELELPVDPGAFAELVIVRWELEPGAWIVTGFATPVGDRVELAVDRDGAWAAVEADPDPFPVPPAGIGLALPSLPTPAFDQVAGATILFTPDTVLPEQTAVADVAYSGAESAPSGLPLTLVVAEELQLLDGTLRREPPYEADLILYRDPSGAPGSSFRLRPSEAARLLPLDVGEEQVEVRLYAGETVRGNVLGADGGSVVDEDGNRIDVPAGALLGPTPIALESLDPATLAVPLPAWLELVAALDLDLSGRALLLPATLGFALDPAPATGERGLVLELVSTVEGARWRPLASAEPAAAGWRSLLDPDLAWPGVRRGGTLAVARALAPFGFFRGTVFDVPGTPLDGARVASAAAGPVQRSGPAGAYVLPAPLGAATVRAREDVRGNGVELGAAIPADAARVELDLPLAIVGPAVLAVAPADGALDVPLGVEPQITFSEAVDPATVPAGVELRAAGGAPVPATFQVQGALATVVPATDLDPETLYEVAVGSAVRDLQGYGLAAPVVSSFTTRAESLPGDVDLSRVLLYEPNGAGRARIQGLAGAVPPGWLVFVENRTRLAATVSVEADPGGAFELEIEAAVTDVLALHVLVPGGNEVVALLGPFRTADGRGAFVGPAGARVTTVDGYTLDIPAGAFAALARIVLTPLAPGAPLPPQPEGFQRAAAFELDFGGATAAAPIEISLPAPAGSADATYLVAREVAALGLRGWMLHALARLDGGRITTEEAPAGFGGGGGAAKGPAAPEGPQAFLPPNHRARLPGVAFAGDYTVSWSPEPFGFFALPFLPGFEVAVRTSLEGLLTVINRSIELLLDGDSVLIPTRLGQPVSVEIFDLATGLELFSGEFDPPAGDGEVVELPPDLYGDERPPAPLAGTPLRIFPVLAQDGLGGQLDAGISYQVAAGTLTVTGEAGAAAGGLRVRLLGLDDAFAAFTTVGEAGDFVLATAVEPGHRYLVALGARVTSETAFTLDFDEGLDPALPGIDVLDENGGSVSPEVAPVGTTTRIRIAPRTSWVAGRRYELVLGPALADASGNRWERELRIDFEVEASAVAGTYELGRAQDIARLGSLLFVAADGQGLVVLDASDPTDLVNYFPSGMTFPFPQSDLVRGVAVDPHGRVLVAGGGSHGFGILRVFDPLRLPAIREASDPVAVRGQAWRGTTIVSDRVGGTGTQLPSGYPRRISVLSNDESAEWVLGQAPPAGIAVELLPPLPPSPFGRVRISGGDGTPGAPVTLRNLHRYGWERVDADASGGYAIELVAEPGDRLELLRNRTTYAYLATLGVGIEIVDVNRFYRPDNTPAPGWTDVVAYYTGAGDPNLLLCNQQVPDLGSALIDVGGLYEDDAQPQLTAVGLVAYRGLALVGSNASNLGALSFVADACAQVDGSRAVFGLETAQDFGLDADGDGAISAAERERDYALVAHGVGGLLIYDLTLRTNPVLVSRIPIPASALHLGLDRRGMRAYVAAGSRGILVIDLTGPLFVGLWDQDGDGLDDRIVERIDTGGISPDAAVAVAGELGLVFAGGEGGVASIAAGRPRLEPQARGGDGRFAAITRLAPLGVPAPNAGEARSGAPSFRVLAAIPAASGETVRLRAAGTSEHGLAVDGAGDLAGLPATELADADGLLFRRLSDRPWEEGAHLYLSEEVAVVADLRAAAAYERTDRENDPAVPGSCERCGRATFEIPETARELLSGEEVRVTFEGELGQRLTDLYGPARLSESELALPSVRWETAPSLRQEPALNPSLGSGEVVPGTLLHSGEFSHDATDLAVRARGIDFAFTRSYRNQTVGAGPLGPGWDLGYRMRLRELPNGDLDFFDGRGRRERFTKRPDGTYESPKGRFAELEKLSTGFRLVDPAHTVVRFDFRGRMTAIQDPVKKTETTGNETTFRHDARGRLTEISDTLGRRYALTYDDSGRLTSLRDFNEREVRYAYDAEGRLASVTSPEVRTGVTQFPQGLKTEYSYSPFTGSLSEGLNRRDNLLTLTDPKGQIPVEMVYEDRDADGREEEVATETWGGYPLSIQYDFYARVTTVTDRRGHDWVWHHNALGQATRFVDPLPATTEMVVDEEGRVTSVSLPLGRVITTVYPTEGSRRSFGNVLESSVTADPRGANGSAETLTTLFQYHEYSNQPKRIEDPRGAVTRIERSDVGLPKTIVEADGTPESGTTTIVYNDFGQPTLVTNPNQHATGYEYFETGAKRGYLKKTTVDPGGLDLKTSYDVDPRGNVVSVTDPRQVRHKTAYNELDWVIETVQADSGSNDGAGRLGYTTTLLHDANGNVVEQWVPFGDGTQFTRIQRDLGLLNELREVRSEVTPGAGDWVRESYTYDPGYNLETVTDPRTYLTRMVYDDRGIVTGIVRAEGTPDQVAESVVSDAEGQPTIWTDGRTFPWTTVYDGFGRVRESRNPLGDTTSWAYDNSGNPVEMRVIDAVEGLLAHRFADYDLRGRRTRDRAQLWTPTDPAREVITELGYDPLGNLRQTTDARTNVTLFGYDAAERMTSRQDAEGNRLELVLDPGGNPVVTRSIETGEQSATVETTASFDALGRAVTQSDALGNVTRFTLDARGNSRLLVDPENHVTEQVFDGLDRLTRRTRPTGILETFAYDAASNLELYGDSKGQTTQYGYDALSRRISTTYPDTTVVSIGYDPTGNVVSWSDPNGTSVTQEYDAAGRLSARTAVLGVGVEGPTLESFTFDALSRVKTASSGGITTSLEYDSLSRKLSETTAGRTVTYAPDDVGNIEGIGYPSGRAIQAGFDRINRPSRIGPVSSPIASFGFRGPDLVARKSLGNGISGSMAFDGARRPTSSVYQTASGSTAFSESIAWSPRSLKSAVEREDRNGSGFLYRYDGAGRLLDAARAPEPSGSTGNNQPVPPEALAGLPESYRYGFDAAQNLLTSAATSEGIEEATSLPPDGSGRNRPASFGAEPLEYDANGNLTRKGSLTYHWDYRNRLTRVSNASGDLATYTYDAFNRKVRRTTSLGEEETVWAGWRPVETFVDGTFSSRRVYGLGLDEIVLEEVDFDRNGTIDAERAPLYDDTGNAVALTDAQGELVEAYRYSPFGELEVVADSTPPAIHQLRARPGELWLEVTEEIDLAVLAQGFAEGTAALIDTATNETVAVTLERAVVTGKMAGRRVVVRPAGDPLPEGTQLTLHLDAETVEDLFGNPAEAAFEATFLEPAAGTETIVTDTANPRLDAILVRAGKLELRFTEELDQATLDSIEIDGNPSTWVLSEDRYTLLGTDTLAAGTRALTVGSGLQDLAGRLLADPLSLPLEIAPGDPSLIAYETPDPSVSPTSGANFRYTFHGLERDATTGLVYARNRWYDPELGRFISTDPLGYVDGPNLYAFAGNDPANLADPLGLCLGLNDMTCAEMAKAMLDALDRRIERKPGTAQSKAIEKGVGHAMMVPITGTLNIGSGLGKALGRIEDVIDGRHPQFDSRKGFRREADAAALDFLQAGSDLALIIPVLRAGVRALSEGVGGLASKGVEGASGEFLPGELMSNGRLAGEGPGAALSSKLSRAEGSPYFDRVVERFRDRSTGMFVRARDVPASLQAAASQGSAIYPGVDRWRDIVVKKGTIIFAGEPGPSGFFTTAHGAMRGGTSSADVFRGLQVAADPLRGYRPGLTAYEVLADAPAAFSITRANPQFGSGGLPQLFVPNFEELTRPLYTILLH